MRWGACAQEICFANDFLSTFFGTGKALPVRRGNGVMQYSWTLLGEQVRKGQWAHVFPEAGVFQTGYGPTIPDPITCGTFLIWLLFS
jgi:hypothetical protein